MLSQAATVTDEPVKVEVRQIGESDTGYYAGYVVATERASGKTNTTQVNVDSSGRCYTFQKGSDSSVSCSSFTEMPGLPSGVVVAYTPFNYSNAELGTAYRTSTDYNSSEVVFWVLCLTAGLKNKPTSQNTPTVTQVPTTGAPSSDLLAPAVIIGMAMLGVALVVRRRRV